MMPSNLAKRIIFLKPYLKTLCLALKAMAVIFGFMSGFVGGNNFRTGSGREQLRNLCKQAYNL